MKGSLARSFATALLAAAIVGAIEHSALAQRGRGAGPAPAAQSPRSAAPIDLTGYWVSIVNEDWRWRMVTPPKGDVSSVPLNPEGRKVAESWDPATDGSCLAYGAAGLMRMPTRLNITWENDTTLKIETDTGTQTRRLLFDGTMPPAASSLQGFSVAEWERPAGGRGRGGFGGPGAGPPAPPAAAVPPPGTGRGAARGAGPPAPPAAPVPPAGAARGRAGAPPPGGGSLKVVTTHLSAAWLRRNGVPYSAQTTMTEYFDRFATPGGDQWLVITTAVVDPVYLNQEFVTSTHFRREPDGSKWDPTACKP
jgi:hypothetical protein